MDIDARFWSHVPSRPPSSCWLWASAVDRHGYGKFKVGGHRGVNVLAHRMAYDLTYGEIPPGMNVLHRCDNPACVQPDHLWAGSQQENIADMDAKNRRRNANAEKAWCKNGHEFTAENTYITPSTGSRNCWTCKRNLKRVASASK